MMTNKTLILAVCTVLLLFAMPVSAADVQVIAIHIGNPEYESILDKSAYPDFQFYHGDGNTYKYQEDQKLIGNPNYLKGYYGPIPEKMGFTANYTPDKERFPYRQGVVYVVNPDGIISAKTGSGYFNEENYYDVYNSNVSNIYRSCKKELRGKRVKPLPEKKREYLKSAPVGKREAFRRSKIDKKDKGLVGWPLPDITVYDDEGWEHSLKDLTSDGIHIVVFYTMNAVKIKRGDSGSGEIIEEIDPEKPVNAEAAINKNLTESSGPGKAIFQSIKTAASKEAELYGDSIMLLDLAKKVYDGLK